MIELSANDFLEVFGNTATAGVMRGPVVIKVATELHMVGMQNVNSTRYTLVCSAAHFRDAKEGTLFTCMGITYKALKPPTIENDEITFICTRQ